MAQNKVKMVKVLNAITLEATEVATQPDASRVVVEAYESDKVSLCLTYVTGAAEAATACNVTLHGFDGTSWHQVSEFSIAAGVATITPTTFRVAGGAGATTYRASFYLERIFQKYKIAASESGVGANKGTLSAVVLVA